MMNDTQMQQNEERNCSKCAYLESALHLTPLGIICGNQADRWFPAGIPEEETCDRFVPRSGKTVKEVAGKEFIEELRSRLKRQLLEELSEEEFEKAIEYILNQDYARFSHGGQKLNG